MAQSLPAGDDTVEGAEQATPGGSPLGDGVEPGTNLAPVKGGFP